MRVALLACGAVLSMAAAAFGGSVSVPGQSNIFGAGHAVPPDPNGGGGGVLPTLLVLSLPIDGGWMEFPSVVGEVSCCSGGATYNGPDGGPFASGNTNITSFGGISGIIHDGATMFLTGVFLGANEPADPAPDVLNFTGADDFGSIAPLLHQTFFIGDGRRSDSSFQRFIIPAGATRLYLGFADAFEFGNPSSPPGFYNDNFGELRVDAVQVPGSGAMLPLVVVGLVRRRRR